MHNALETLAWDATPAGKDEFWNEEGFIRHPSELPARIQPAWAAPTPRSGSRCSRLGLILTVGRCVGVGTTLSVEIKVRGEHHRFQGQVVMLRRQGSGFEMGLRPGDEDEGYRLRMIEQVCHIEAYHRRIEQKEGRSLSSETAAREWIERYAWTFPSL